MYDLLERQNQSDEHVDGCQGRAGGEYDSCDTVIATKATALHACSKIHQTVCVEGTQLYCMSRNKSFVIAYNETA